MAVTRGVIVQYRTNAGSVPAVTLDQRNDDGDSVVIGSATRADLLLLGWNNAKFKNVEKDTSTDEADVDVNKFWVPA